MTICTVYRSLHHSSTFYHDLQYHICKAENFNVQPHLWAPSIVGICVLQRDLFWNLRSPNEMCILPLRTIRTSLEALCPKAHFTQISISKRNPELGHISMQIRQTCKHTKTNNINHSNFMFELWFTQMQNVQNVQKQSSISCSILSSLGYFITFKKMCQLHAFNIV